MGRYTISWLILLVLVQLWLTYFLVSVIGNARPATQQEIESDLGAGSWCVSTTPDHWDCVYPVLYWRCSQAGGFSAHCVPEGM